MNYSRNVKQLLANRLNRKEIALIYKMAHGNDMNALLKP